MKKKVALLLAAVMTTAMLPMNVMANSANDINKKVTVKDDTNVNGVYLKITPKDEIETGASIIITLDNGKFDEEEWKDNQYKEAYAEAKNNNKNEEEAVAAGNKARTGFKSYETEFKGKGNYGSYDEIAAKYIDNEIAIRNLFDVSTDSKKTGQLPYKIQLNSKREIQVTLFPLPVEYADNTVTPFKSKPNYYIPIEAIANGSGDVKITIDDNGSSVTGGSTYTIATASSASGSTTTTVAEIENFQDLGYLEDITIKENVLDTFEQGKPVKVRLSGGYQINTKKSEGATVSAGSNAKFDTIKAVDELDSEGKVVKPAGIKFEKDDTQISFNMPIGGTTKPSAIKISGLVIEAEDEDKNWGDVSVTVSGASITKESITVATRSDYGFKLTALEDPTTVVSGRSHIANTDLDEDDFATAQIKFEETIKDTWLTSRKLEFTLPEGVKIVDFEFEDDEYIDSDLNSLASITNDGQTLRIDKGIELDDSDCSLFELTFYLSVDADYVGEIPVSVSGAGIAADTITDVVIANAIAPINIESNSTNANMGYQALSTADITITEAQEGLLLDDEKVVIAIDSLYGSDELGFADENIDYSIDGELEIKSFKVSKGEISFTVDKESYTEPSAITIKNVKVGTTRSVPFGSYDFIVYGSAVINNYNEDEADKAKYPSEVGADGLAYFDTTDSYSFADYLVVVTETGTLDKKVEVTIGEKTILMDNESVDMDTAAYIQASSNSTMVPLRFVALAIGVDSANAATADDSSKVLWDANTKTATILYASGNGQKIIQFQAGSANMTVDGSIIPMENGVVAEITDSRMFVPFRALGQALGVTVAWDADTRTAIYNNK